jgi:uncharacterized membrane protein YdjX (TVP38/TMEM64 family)
MKKKLVWKVLVIVSVIAVMAVYKFFHIGDYLTLSFIKDSQNRFADLYAEHPAGVIASYMVSYVLVTSLSLPGAAIMTLAGGALFGLWTGIVVVSFASAIGATLACAVSRFLLRDWVQVRFGEKLVTVNDGIEREGAFYLFTLRLIPIFPFWLINLLMGVTKIPLRTFYWVSQVGMLAGTVVYVNAGRELGRVDSLSGILSPGLILSFVFIGLLPITVKKLLTLYTSRRK